MWRCASKTPAPRTNLDPLFHAPSGTGEYPVDPATLERQAHALGAAGPAPAVGPANDAPEPCKHTWQYLDQQTHTYIDREGSIALCTPRYCTQCGMVIHECSTRGR